MAVRRPIVRVDGELHQLAEGDYVAGTPVAFPFWLTTGERDDIPLTAMYELPFWLSNGSQANISVVVTA